jgi:hypothetical protein
MFHQVLLRMPDSKQVSHCPGETAIRIDCNQLSRKSITQVTFGTIRKQSWVWSKPHTQGPTGGRNVQITVCPRSYPCPRTYILPASLCPIYNNSQPELNYLALRFERLIRPAKWKAVFNLDQGPTTIRSLTDIDEINIAQPNTICI